MTELVASGLPYRDTFWNIPMWARVFVYVGGTAAIAVFAWRAPADHTPRPQTLLTSDTTDS